MKIFKIYIACKPCLLTMTSIAYYCQWFNFEHFIEIVSWTNWAIVWTEAGRWRVLSLFWKLFFLQILNELRTLLQQKKRVCSVRLISFSLFKIASSIKTRHLLNHNLEAPFKKSWKSWDKYGPIHKKYNSAMKWKILL